MNAVVPAFPSAEDLSHVLTSSQFTRLATVSPALSSFANLDNPQKRRAYQNDVQEFMAFAGIDDPHQLRDVVRGHVLAWRRDLEQLALSEASIRRKLAALSSLLEHLCEANAITSNPVDGVRRSKMASADDKTPAIGDH